MGENRSSGRERPGSASLCRRPAKSWVVGGRPDCSHPVIDALSMGLGGMYAYDRCRRCGGVIVSRLGDDSEGAEGLPSLPENR